MGTKGFSPIKKTPQNMLQSSLIKFHQVTYIFNALNLTFPVSKFMFPNETQLNIYRSVVCIVENFELASRFSN